MECSPAKEAVGEAPERRAPVRAARGAAALGLGAIAFAASGCAVKSNVDPNLILGKQQFVAKCGACHTLARANTKGLVGPNLDEAFRASIDEGLGRNTIRSVVEHQVAYPNPEGAMPKGLVSGTVLTDIAAYIARSAAAPGGDTGLLASAVEAPGAGKPAVEKAGKLEIAASPSGQLAYTTAKATATPGPVTIVMSNMSGVMHNVAVEAGENGATAKGAALGASSFITKGTTSVTVSLKPGKYTFFCQAPGHRAAGMYGTITVK